ncbi:MAG: tetratricopeptide repeat protein, partial [Candidatus Brocadiae bacterium]|nr:tetratricopeptide repeat protein [Candidatus Brocadiia bacterium]
LQGRAAQRRGDLETADQRFETAALLRPSHAPLQLEAALWFWEAPDPRYRATGIVCLRRALEQSPEFLDEALDLYWTPDDPVEPWIPALTSPPAAARFAAFLSRTGRWREATDAFERTVPADPRHAAAWDQFAQGLKDAGQWGLEAQVRERRLAVKSDAQAHLLAARAWIRLEAWDDAHRNARIASRIDPGLLDAHLILADALEGRGDALDAVEALTAALRSKPDDAVLKLRRAALFERQKMYIPAIEDYEEVVKAEPANRDGVLGLARSLLGAGRKESARGVIQGWLGEHPLDAEALQIRSGL